MHRLDRLDHLRAIAAFMVIVWHFTSAWPYKISSGFKFLSILKQGSTGVSFFCVISGFILTYIYIEKDVPKSSFLKNRFLRIAPLYLLITCLAFYVSEWDLASLVLTTLTGMSRGGLPSYAGPGWTVLIEFQFYLLFPFLLIFMRNYGPRYIAGLLLTMLVIRYAVWNSSGTVQLLSYYSIFGRIDQFLIGILAALAMKDKKIQGILAQNYVSIFVFSVGVLSAILFFWWFNSKGGLLNFSGQPWPSKSALWITMPTIEGIIYSFIVVSYLQLPAVRGFSFLSKIFSYVGLVSYSIYLDHILLFPSIFSFVSWLGIVPASWEQSLLICIFITMPILVAVASLTYYFIEAPFIKLRSSSLKN